MSSADMSQPQLWKSFKNLPTKKSLQLTLPRTKNPNLLPRTLLPWSRGGFGGGRKWDPCGAAAPQGPVCRAEPGPGLAPAVAALQEDSIDVSSLCNHPASALAINKGLRVVVEGAGGYGFSHSLIQPSVVVFPCGTGMMEISGGTSASVNETAAI